MVNTKPRRWKVRFPFFRDYCSASLLAGGLLGFAVMASNDLSASLLEVWMTVLGYAAVLLIPGIVRRSIVRVLLGLIPGLMVAYYLWVFLSIVLIGVTSVGGDQFVINWTPGPIRAEGPESYFSLLWGYKGMLALLVPLDVVSLFLRAGGIPKLIPFLRAIVLSSLAVIVLYSLASIGRSPGAPRFAHITMAWVASAVAFWLIFPAKYALLHWLYEPGVFFAPYGGKPAAGA